MSRQVIDSVILAALLALAATHLYAQGTAGRKVVIRPSQVAATMSSPSVPELATGCADATFRCGSARASAVAR